jgi:hypothetical protein
VRSGGSHHDHTSACQHSRTLEQSNQNVSFLQATGFKVASGGMTGAGKAFAADMGTFGSVSTQKTMTRDDKATYSTKVNAKVTAWCKKVTRGEKVNVQVWTDDFTRLTILQRFNAASSRSRNNYWTTIAAKGTELIDYHQPRHIYDANGHLVPLCHAQYGVGHRMGRFYKCWVGVEMHATPKVRQVLCCLEMLMAGWTEIREDTLRSLEQLSRTGARPGDKFNLRFDVTAFVYFFEHHLPLALLSYSIMLREATEDDDAGARPDNPEPYGGGGPGAWGGESPQGVKPNKTTATDPGMKEARAWVHALKHLCVLAHVRQRPLA